MSRTGMCVRSKLPVENLAKVPLLIVQIVTHPRRTLGM